MARRKRRLNPWAARRAALWFVACLIIAGGLFGYINPDQRSLYLVIATVIILWSTATIYDWVKARHRDNDVPGDH